MNRVLAMALVLSLTACGGEESKKAQCVEGATQGCLLSNGDDGVQVCQAGGTWALCQPFTGNDVTVNDVVHPVDLAPLDVGDGPDVPTPQDVAPHEDTEMPDDVPVAQDVFLPEDTAGSDAVCEPQCDEKVCGDDECGGLCNDCAEFVFDDGDTDTAFGYSQPPDPAPSRIACMVRFELPFADMKLVEFAAGWMYGLYSLQIPFELAWVSAEDVECEAGPDGAWYKEYCTTSADKFVSIGDFLPLEPYDVMDAEMLGEVTFTSQTVFVTTFFDIDVEAGDDAYPIFVCPIDTAGSGSNSFMMSQVGENLAGPAFDKTEKDEGVIPFRIKVSL